MPFYDTNRDLQNKALQINQIANRPEKQPISDWIGSLPLIDIPIQAKNNQHIVIEIPRTSFFSQAPSNETTILSNGPSPPIPRMAEPFGHCTPTVQEVGNVTTMSIRTRITATIFYNLPKSP